MGLIKPVKSSGDGTSIYTTEIYTQGGNGVPVTVSEPDEQGQKSLTIDAWMDTDPADIVSGKKAVTNEGIVEGSHVCPEAPALPALNNPADDAHILKGYEALDGAGVKMTGSHVCKTVAELTADADATAGDIAEGKTAYVDGVKIVGSLVASEVAHGTIAVSSQTATVYVPGMTKNNNVVVFATGKNKFYSYGGLVAVYRVNGTLQVASVTSDTDGNGNVTYPIYEWNSYQLTNNITIGDNSFKCKYEGPATHLYYVVW